MQRYDDYPEQYQPALNLLIPLWRGLAADYKTQYARNIWQQYEDNIRNAAYTNSLNKFVSSICSRLPITIRGDDVAGINDVLNAGQDRALLKLLRGETTTLTLMVRLENDKRRSEWRKYDIAAGHVAAAPTLAPAGLFDDEDVDNLNQE